MANTVIALKKSATPSSVPSNLANGELAINYADGKLYYRAANGTIASISGNEPNYFGTVSANGTLLVADMPGDILTVNPGNNISIIGDAVNDRMTIGLKDDVNIPGKLNVGSDFTHTGGNFYINNGSGAGGSSEGGEIKLANATQNQVLSGPVSIDIYENKLRFFETNAPNRGAFINIASASAGVGTDLLAGASATDSFARATASQAFDKANAALPNVSGVSFNGNLTVSQNLTSDRVVTLNNGIGENFKVGDDSWIGDTNIANTLRIKGQQNASIGYILFGPNDGKLLGRAGTDNLTYDGNTIWHAGTDGAGSGLDADLLDGQHGSYYGIASDVTAAFLKANNALSNTTGSVFNGELYVPTLYAGNFNTNWARMRFVESGNVSYIQSGTSTQLTGRPIHFTPIFSASATMVIDVANVAVGIGRTDPVNRLDVVGTANASNILINGNMVGTVGGIAAAFASANAGQATANAAFDTANTATALGTAARSIANLAFIHANNAFANANTVMISAQAAFTVANSGFIHANSGYAFANSIAITANLAFAHANAAFANGNTVIQTAQSAFTQANAAIASASAGQATANAAYAFANSAHAIANLAFTHANNAFARANIANITADLAFNHANAAFATVNSAFGIANNALPRTGGTVTGNLAVTGTLTVQGNVFLQDTQTIVVSDPLLYLAGNNYSSDIVDIGFVANYVNATGQNVHTGLFRDATTKEYYIFEGYDKEPNPNHIDTAGNNFTISVLNATLKTSNLILGGVNAISTIGASFNHANAAHASANAGMAIANGAFASANAAQATANAAFNRANTANITADRAWNHANAAFNSANIALSFRGTINETTYGDNTSNATRTTGTYQVLYPGASDALIDLGGIGGSSPRIQIRFNYADEMYFRVARDSEVNFDTAGPFSNRVWHSSNDGTGSGLDADLLDGQQGTYYGIATDVTAANRVANAAFLHANAAFASVNSAVQNTSSVTFIGTANNALYAYGKTEGTLSVNTATQLTTARTLTIGSTGKNFNGTAGLSWTTTEIGAEYQAPSGVPRNNLGDPTVREMALFDGQFTNKTEFFDINNLYFETSTDNVTWSNYSVTDAQKRLFLNGDLSYSSIAIPYGTAYFRVRLRATSYVYLNALYSYWSASGHSTQVQVFKKHDLDAGWTQHTSSTTYVSSWPGHLYLPFTTIPWNPSGTQGTHFHEVYFLFIPSWNATYSSNNISLYKFQVWGGYPSGRRNLYSTNEYGDAAFPSNVSATSIFATGSVGIGTSAPAYKLDVTGNIRSTNYVYGDAALISPLFTYNGAADLGITHGGNYSIKFVTNGTLERMRVDAGGNVGIGTTSPTYPLQVAATGKASYIGGVLVGANGTDIRGSLGVLSLQSNGANEIQFWTNSGEKVRVDANGNVGIGTTSPAQKLDVTNGNIVVSNGYGYKWGTGGAFIDGSSATSTNYISIGTNNNSRLYIDHSGNLGVGTTSPGSKLHVNGTGVTIARISDTSATGYSGLVHSGTGTQSYAIGMGGPSETAFSVANKWFIYDSLAGVMRVVVDTSGNVLIGRTTSTVGQNVKLDVNGAVNASAVLVNGAPISGGAYYSGNNGDVGSASGLGDIFRVHTNTLNANVTIYSGNNALAAGPITIASGRVLTIQANARISIV